ncbi:hypothetical protein K450DRAFT_223752 [Umbelopsis ramanniana AG]|uniref:Uncharacterized protein n=1 Tax=Umbelopsis ramanniana AG TaxID=1314678 RepID=A0AAD5HHW9_UMBRA|nr:uncharacterized protein K450DRAFT_223752 [Umbelopsis ramanniana AG]KAI8583454.1 hypothetical protein K450DRAFT_223752 [Umbelopsis ramanniana AG]
MSRSGDHSHLVREVEAPTTPASQVKTYDAIPPSSNRSFLSSVVDLFQQAKTNATSEFDQLYDTFSVSRENVTPQKNSNAKNVNSNRQRVEKRYSQSTPSAKREKHYITSLTPHFERQNIRDSPIRSAKRQAISSARTARHWEESKNETDFHPNRSLTKALEKVAVDDPSILHNTTSYLSTNSNSRTRLDLDELDDELHRVARLDHNLDIVRQQVQALFTTSSMEYNGHESSFVSKKSSYFEPNNAQGEEPSTHETVFSEPHPQAKLIRSSSVIHPEYDIYNRASHRNSNDNEISLMNRSSKLPSLQISPVPLAKPLPTHKTPSKSSPYRRPFRASSPSPHKTQHHPQRLLSKSPKPSTRFSSIADSSYRETGTSTPLRNSKPSAHERTHITNFGHTQLNNAPPPRTLFDELSNAGASFNNAKKTPSQRTTVLKRLDDSEVFSGENSEYFNTPHSKDNHGTNIIPGDEYTFHGQRFRIEEEIS